VGAILDYTFHSCGNLANVAIPATITNIGMDVFEGCPSLLTISVDPRNKFYSSADGVLFNRSQTALIAFPAGRTGSYAIPDGVVSIAAAAFYGCPALTNVTVPASVRTIGSQAFDRSFHLAGIYFKGNAPAIGTDPIFSFHATVYYLPGKLGWSYNFAYLPTVLWNPQINTRDSGFGIQNGKFGFNVTGTPNISLVVEASSNPANPIWTRVQTMTLTNGTVHFAEPLPANGANRFYRLRSP